MKYTKESVEKKVDKLMSFSKKTKALVFDDYSVEIEEPNSFYGVNHFTIHLNIKMIYDNLPPTDQSYQVKENLHKSCKYFGFHLIDFQTRHYYADTNRWDSPAIGIEFLFTLYHDDKD